MPLAVLSLLIIFSYVPGIKANLRMGAWGRINNKKSPYQMVGETIGRKYPGSLIMTRRSEIPYYAMASWLLIPYEPIDRIISFAKDKGVDLILIDPDTAKTRPHLAHLLKQDVEIKGLELVYGFRNPTGKGLLFLAVYRVEK